ncbi:uncharacterized protein LOC129224780 [Uloborus diversus]|uniref:uncharacterized protein LOC129224780 n=1 Tax=Uloborus diversus TaxID=327109 RepID=UPI0024094EF5|nr:uncharacterized protein LOC129224780 [Uloborus diversus]
MACLKRFIARRSKPSTIWSDNATNFKGARSVLNQLFQICRKDHVQRFCAEENIEWKFIPPASPHFGGLWEANIKSTKKLLLKVTKSSVLTFEELNTLIVQIEAILNSRPICPLSSDPTDLQPLTPGHFLVGAPLLSIPENDTALDSLSLPSRWVMIQKLRKDFWNRWSKEYLNSLQTRGKWRQATANLKVGQLALLKDNCSTTPLNWTLCRIEKVYLGEDGKARVADVRTPAGTYTRSITRLSPLPFAEEVGHPSNGGRHVCD